MKKIWIVTLFPESIKPYLQIGVLGRFIKKMEEQGKLKIELINLKEYSLNNYGSVDDSPYGGGPGMVIRADVLWNVLEKGIVIPGNYGENFKEKLHIVFPSPRGYVWNAERARTFAQKNLNLDEAEGKDIVFLSGRYEGIDARFIKLFVNEEISVCDFVLTGGELAILTLLDSSFRFVPKVLGNELSADLESFSGAMLEHPQYTRPNEFMGEKVPEVLSGGNHAKIVEYQKSESLRLTKLYRPDLLNKK